MGWREMFWTTRQHHMFDWTCRACGEEHEATCSCNGGIRGLPTYPSLVICSECGALHRVEVGADGPQVFAEPHDWGTHEAA